jgi:hypothetical protein
MTVFAFSAAVLAGPGKIADIGIRKRLAVCQLVNPEPCYAVTFIRLVFLERHIVFGHTGNHTGSAAGALVQINDHSKFFVFFFTLFFFHQNLML